MVVFLSKKPTNILVSTHDQAFGKNWCQCSNPNKRFLCANASKREWEKIEKNSQCKKTYESKPKSNTTIKYKIKPRKLHRTHKKRYRKTYKNTKPMWKIRESIDYRVREKYAKIGKSRNGKKSNCTCINTIPGPEWVNWNSWLGNSTKMSFWWQRKSLWESRLKTDSRFWESNRRIMWG